MIHLRKVKLKTHDTPKGFPFTLPLIHRFGELSFTTPITLFVGENGSGKSTLLEGLAAAIGTATIGGERLEDDATLVNARNLAKFLTLTWNRKTHRGFFMRAEDFFRFTRRIYETVADLDRNVREFEEKFSGYALQLARGAMLGQKQQLTEKYGDDPDSLSHGESFLRVFRERFVPDGIYLLDEPETPLSPSRQLTLLSMIKQMAQEENAQFIISTHSPILMALPGAVIYSFDSIPLTQVRFEDLEHVTLMRSFLTNPELYLRHL